MPNGNSSSRCCLCPSLVVGLEPQTCARSSTPFSTYSARAASGATCPKSSRLGRPCIITTALGSAAACGGRCIAPFIPKHGFWQEKMGIPRRLLWTRNPQNDGKRGTRGFDAHKRVKGRKRAILVDTSGLLLCCRVEPASLQDRSLAYGLLAGLQPLWPKLACVFADAGFQSEPLAQWLEKHCGWRLEIVRRSASGFTVQPKRWVVERTFAWFGRNRRLSKDYEQTVQSSEAWMWIAMLRLVLRRLGKPAE